MARPGYHPSNVRKNSSMVSDASLSRTQENILLSTDIHQNSFTARFYKLPNHTISFPAPT
jgi:hypothetical protein